MQNKEIGHMSYMTPLKEALASAGDKVVYVFYDFETTQNTEYPDDAKLHVHNLVCLQKLCSRCEGEEEGIDCLRCGRRKHLFWEDSLGDLLSYVTEPRPMGQ